MPVSPPNDFDPELMKLANFKIFKAKEGELLAVMIQLGNRLGLFEALDASPKSSQQLADQLKLSDRWVSEWLYAVCAGGLVTKTGDVFSMELEMAYLLARPDAPGFVGTMFNAPVSAEVVDRLVEAFSTGLGFSWDDHGESTCHMQAEMSGGRDRHFLVSDVLPSIAGLIERLREGIRVIDIGCGTGAACLVMAEAFPDSTFLGLDPSGHAIAEAKRASKAKGLSNVTFAEGVFDDLKDDSADFVLVIDVLHDLPRPVEAIGAVRRALTSDGVWLVVDITAGETYEDNSHMPLLSLFYSMSVIYCMNSALSEPGGAGLGTLGLHPERLRGWVEGAGFSSLTPHRFDHDTSNTYYEVRP